MHSGRYGSLVLRTASPVEADGGEPASRNSQYETKTAWADRGQSLSRSVNLKGQQDDIQNGDAPPTEDDHSKN